MASQLVDQGVIAPGSDGTTVTASDMLALKTLSVADQGIVQLDGLQYAANLTSLDLGGNEIATITPLAGLTNLTELDASGNELDLALGSPAMAVISALKGCGVHVAYMGDDGVHRLVRGHAHRDQDARCHDDAPVATASTVDEDLPAVLQNRNGRSRSAAEHEERDRQEPEVESGEPNEAERGPREYPRRRAPRHAQHKVHPHAAQILDVTSARLR